MARGRARFNSLLDDIYECGLRAAAARDAQVHAFAVGQIEAGGQLLGSREATQARKVYYEGIEAGYAVVVDPPNLPPPDSMTTPPEPQAPPEPIAPQEGSSAGATYTPGPSAESGPPVEEPPEVVRRAMAAGRGFSRSLGYERLDRRTRGGMRRTHPRGGHRRARHGRVNPDFEVLVPKAKE